MNREAIPTWFFVLVAVKHKDRYLLIHERKHGQLWYLPAGRVEPGESFIAAAKRETLEESGIPIVVNGIIRIEHSPFAHSTRVRLIVSGEPLNDTPPKSEPDEESLEAGWFTVEQMRNLALRGHDVLEVFSYLDAGGVVAPITILTHEGASFV
ncbi:NUDIX domain-containing protein [Candidatus Halobeggiatoa sp. HSG11]|nr:NUDIX domain-containing protein [Candidatus Halobeggiatoa sp. HSG11]